MYIGGSVGYVYDRSNERLRRLIPPLLVVLLGTYGLTNPLVSSWRVTSRPTLIFWA